MPTFMDSSSGFIKQVFWLNHWPVVTGSKNRSPLLSPKIQEDQTFNHTAEDTFDHMYYWTLLKYPFMACLHIYEKQKIPDFRRPGLN